MVNKHRKRLFTSLVTREMLTKPQRDVTSHLLEWHQKRQTAMLQGCGRKGALGHCWWEYKLVQSVKTAWRFLKNNKPINRTTIWLSHPTLGMTYEGNKISRSYLHPRLHCSIIHISQDREAAWCSLTEKWIRKMWDTHTTHNRILSATRRKRSCRLWAGHGPWRHYAE